MNTILYKDVLDIIFDYKEQLEVSDKYRRVVNEINNKVCYFNVGKNESYLSYSSNIKHILIKYELRNLVYIYSNFSINNLLITEVYYSNYNTNVKISYKRNLKCY